MNLNEMSFKNEVGENPPECVLREPLEKHLPNVNEFSHAVLALTFDSGPAQNKTARSYVFYFYKEEINPERRPDDILTFKIKFMDPHNIHIVDKYLGGMSFGALNAPALSYRHLWQPGMMSKEGKEKSMAAFTEKKTDAKSGCFIATATFGSTKSPEVIFLREFRDKVLIQSLHGRLFIDVYYRFSPYMARFIEKSGTLKYLVRTYFLYPLIRLLKSKLFYFK